MLSALRRTNIKVRILCLPVLFLAALLAVELMNLYFKNAVESRVTFPKVQNHILNGHKGTLKAVVEIEAATLGEKVKNLKTREEKIAVVMTETDPLRFFDDKSGYYFTYDMAGVRINVPINKSDNGKNLIALEDKKGNRFVADFVKAAKNGGGFVEYWFEKEGKGLQPKLSYIQAVPGTDFLIGTGVYIDNVETETNALKTEIDSKASEYTIFGMAILLSITALVFLASLLIARSVTRSIGGTIQGLLSSAEQVAAASNQVATAGRQLAEGASEQAASLEETTSSLEEMSSMIRQNAENADQASRLTDSTRDTVSLAGVSMERLTASMTEISRASEETSKIIKTIDEIAFQTNLLALNAAVEAARAGEAGAGFAVVADEVRNLAMRAADAAKNTAGLIEGTVKKVKEGSELVVKTDREFRDVALSVTKSSELVSEITQASREQSYGIEQINKAVGEMDKVVQTNAASAEESSSASEEMHSQAEHMKNMVDDLMKLVGGAGAKRTTAAPKRRAPADTAARTVVTASVKARKSVPGKHNGRGKEPALRAGSGKTAASSTIRLEAKDYEEF